MMHWLAYSEASTIPDSWRSNSACQPLCDWPRHPGSRRRRSTPCAACETIPIPEDSAHDHSSSGIPDSSTRYALPGIPTCSLSRVVPCVVELLLLDRSRDRSADRITLQERQSWDFIDTHTHHPDAPFCKPSRIPIAPKDLLRSLLEPSIQARCLPIAGAMGLQIDIAQDISHGAWADASHNSIRHGLAGQVVTRPMCDVQSFGHGFQTSKFNDLCPLQRRDLHATSRVALSLISEQSDEPKLPILLTGSPDRGVVALELESDVFSPLACSNTQNNSGTPNLIPGQCIAVCDSFQFGDVPRDDSQHIGLASTHTGSSHAEIGAP